MNAKKKGNAGENKFANWLRDNGIKAWKDGASGGGTREKADVGNNLNLHIEVKTVKKINLRQVWNKAELECQKTHNDPLIATHFDGMRENEWLITLHSDTWLHLLKASQTPSQASNSAPTETFTKGDRELAYCLQTLKISLNKTLKVLQEKSP